MGRASSRKRERREGRTGLKQSSKGNSLTPASQLQPAERGGFKGEVIYRFFDDPSHADDLAAGKVWISTLEACRRYENQKRGDPEEAVHRYNSGFATGNGDDPEFVEIARRSMVLLGPDVTNGVLSNNTVEDVLIDAFVLCTTENADPTDLEEKFGPYCVKISNSERFFDLVTKRLHQCREDVLENLMGKVHYRDRNWMGLEDPPGIPGFVKPVHLYQVEQEVRFLWTVRNPSHIRPFLLEVPEAAHLCIRVR